MCGLVAETVQSHGWYPVLVLQADNGDTSCMHSIQSQEVVLVSHDACRGRTEIQAQFLLLSMVTHPPGNLIWLLSVPWLGWCLDKQFKVHVGIRMCALHCLYTYIYVCKCICLRMCVLLCAYACESTGNNKSNGFVTCYVYNQVNIQMCKITVCAYKS